MRYQLAAACVALAPLAAHAAIVSFTGDVLPIAPPSSALLGANPIPVGGLAWNEQQGIAIPPTFVDLAGSGTFGTDPSGIIAGTVDSHFLHFDILTAGPIGGMAVGTVTFSGPIVGVCVLDAALDFSDPLAGSPGTLYPTFDPQRASGISLGGYVITSGSTLSFQILVGTGEYQQLRVFTIPAPGTAMLLAAAGWRSTRRRR